MARLKRVVTRTLLTMSVPTDANVEAAVVRVLARTCASGRLHQEAAAMKQGRIHSTDRHASVALVLRAPSVMIASAANAFAIVWNAPANWDPLAILRLRVSVADILPQDHLIRLMTVSIADVLPDSSTLATLVRVNAFWAREGETSPSRLPMLQPDSFQLRANVLLP